jgi:hypothetical protein
LDDKEDFAEESPQALDQGPADPPDAEPEVNPADAVEARKPGLYVLRPRGIRPAPRGARRRLGRLRNDCPPDRRRASNRPALKPRIR